MSVVAFWNNGKEQTGKTLSIIAVATYLAIERNFKILVISTGLNDKTLNNCFWEEKKSIKNLGLFGPNTSSALENGIEGLAKIIRSNKVAPESITNYTKVIFKDHLEVLQGFKGTKEEYEQLKESYLEIISAANGYYDLVLVDVDREMGTDLINRILEKSNLVVASLSQRLLTLNNFIESREKMPILKSKKTLLLIGRYDKYSKYTIKNISRYLGERNKVSTIPYNTLYFEACEEASVPDFFLSIRNLGEEDRNGFFLAEVKRTAENIIYRIQDLAMRM